MLYSSQSASVASFWFLTVLSVMCALAFVVPALLLAGVKKRVTMGFIVLLPLGAYLIYASLGAGQQLAAYYSPAVSEQRHNNAQLRPFYARLQRQMVKNHLNLEINAADLDLILNFASIDSKLAAGLLQPEIKSLLENVLRTMPHQITALNLLAVNAYKSQSYNEAIAYWERIMQQFTPALRGSNAEKVITAKIAEARLFESRRTK